MSGMMFDPELLKLWDPAMQAWSPAGAGFANPGGEFAKVAAQRPVAAPTATPPAGPLPLPPEPPPVPPPLPGQSGADAATTMPEDKKPEALTDAPRRDLLTRLGLTAGGVKDPRPVDLAALLRGLAQMARPPAAAVPRPVAQPAPPGHRPQGGSLPMRQATPGNPYLRAATPGAPATPPRRRGLLDAG